MKILIVGAGIIGSVYGWALAGAGHEVRHLVRKGRGETYAKGLPVDILDKRRGFPRRFRGTYALAAVETPETDQGPYDLLVVPGHHYALAEVLAEVVPRVPRASVLFLTQNWAGPGEIDAVLPRSRYCLGDAKAGGYWQDGTLVGALHSLDIGPAGPEGEPAVLAAAQALAQARIPAPVHADMVPYLWVQFAMTGALWPALVEAGSFQAVLADRKTVFRSLDAMLECLALLEKRGVDLARFPETKLYRSRSAAVRLLALGYLRWAFRYSEFMKRTSAHALADKAEVRAFYYDLLGTARDLGHPMPVFEAYRNAVERFLEDGLHSSP